MKKFALNGSLVLAVTLAFAGVFASASDVLSTSNTTTLHYRISADPLAKSIPAQLLTIRCGDSKGDLVFSVDELETMTDLALKHPELAPKVCGAFTKRT